jgi:L-serine dehydratase
MPYSAFDIIGPSMVGPSSSHTAGAAKIGRMARELLGEEPRRAVIELHGSFAATGKGHATDRALVAGILGMAPDDERLKDSLEIAKQAGLEVEFREVDLGEESHPNAARITLTSESDHSVCVTGWSVGGGSILIREIDGFDTRFSGELDTLVLWHKDQTGYLAKVTTLFDCAGVNIATIRLSRAARGAAALTTIESDGPLGEAARSIILGLPATNGMRALAKS